MSGEVAPTLPFEDLVQSDLFTFYIGAEKKRFMVHSKAIAATSEHFNALVNGNMMEGTTKSAELLDVEPADFARFLEFAYRNDYSVPPCATDKDFESSESLEPDPNYDTELQDDEYDSPSGPSYYRHARTYVSHRPITIGLGMAPQKGATKRRDNGKIYKANSRNSFEERYPLSEKNLKAGGMLESFEPQYNTSPEQDFTPIFTAHARLYTFADMRLVQPLKDLAFNKLCKTLLGFKLYDQRVDMPVLDCADFCTAALGDIISLARYAYAHGPDRTSSGTIDDLRWMVVEYVAYRINVIKKHDAFKELMEEGGEFVGDLWSVVQNRFI